MNRKEFNHKLGWALRSQRRIRNVTAESIAAKLNISLAEIRKYENGINSISARILIGYCNALKANPNLILNSINGNFIEYS